MKRTMYKGQNYSKEVVLTLPNQALSLAEIIERFVRHEPLQIGKDVSYHESDDDLEKLQRLDPVDRMAYIRKMQDIQDKFKQQEEDRRIKLEEKTRAEFLENLKKEAQNAATQPPAK